MIQRSVEDELERGSSADIPTVMLSYLVMFLYIAFALGAFVRIVAWLTIRTMILAGEIKFDRHFCVRTKLLLAFTAILVRLTCIALKLFHMRSE